MILPNLLMYIVPRIARTSPPLRASNEGLLRPCVARAQGTHRAIPPLLATFFSILLNSTVSTQKLIASVIRSL
jgi:hypothetical protein